MPVYEVQLSDGRRAKVEGDRPPTEEEVLGIIGDVTPTVTPKKQALLDEQKALRDETPAGTFINPLYDAVESLTAPGIASWPVRAWNSVTGSNYADPPPIEDFAGGLLTEPLKMMETSLGMPGWLTNQDSPVAGVAEGIEDTISGIVQPQSLVTLPAAFNPLGRSLMSFDMLRGAADQTEEAKRVVDDPNSTVSDVARAFTMPAASTTMATMLGRHGLKSEPAKAAERTKVSVDEAEVARQAEPKKSELPPMNPDERIVTVQQPNGTTYKAAFSGKFYERMSKDKPGEKESVPSIARIVGEPGKEGWSHGMLAPGEKILPEGEPIRDTPPVTPRVEADLSDVYRIFEPAPKTEKLQSAKNALPNIIESIRTGVSSKFRPLDKLAEDISKSYGTSKKGLAHIFEQIKGSSGKGEADIYRFDQDVSKAVKGNEKDFNAYMFLRRSIDRLNQDAADIARAQAGENVPNLNRRAVAGYTLNELNPKLQFLEKNLGPERLAKFEQAANEYQRHMDQALRLQVESGRMSSEVYDGIKSGNQFYAPFKVMKYLEEASRPEGTGRKMDTMADYTKAMEGIEDKSFRLGDMLGAARQNILISRILSDKNNAMRKFSEMAAFDTRGEFVKRLSADGYAPQGMEVVNVLEGGKPVRYAVNPDVAQAIQLYGDNAGGIISSWLSKAAIPFRAGATTFNVPFQAVNLLAADAPRSALVSKYGIRGVRDLIVYPLQFVESLLSSMAGNVFKVKNKTYLDFLDSGAAGATVQDFLTPRALQFNPGKSKIVGFTKSVLGTVPDFARAIEETSKVLGVKRAMKFEGVESGAQLAKQIPEAVTEVRRFSGSPDFGRQGKWVEQARLNLLYMFLNARIQGSVADLGRLTGRDGAGTASKMWGMVGTAIGIPTAYLYFLNHSAEYADDYDKRPKQEKDNYWLIPKDSYITTSDGEKMRDYWRIPKRESAKWIGNMVESGLAFAEKKDPQTFGRWAQTMMEDISPVNIQGDSFRERTESVASSLNPLIKAPLELATGRDMYRHRNIVPDSQEKASPENQYTDRTAEVFKTVANALPDVAPEVFRSPLMIENLTKNLTAGLLTQFLPKKPMEGRSALENNPLLQRFQALPYTDQEKFRTEMDVLERQAVDEQLTRHRNASKLLEDNKGKPIQDIAKLAIAKYGQDRRLIEHVIDLWIADRSGINRQQRQVLSLPVRQRAEYIVGQLKGQSPEKQSELLRDFAIKRIFTEAVAGEMAPLLKQ